MRCPESDEVSGEGSAWLEPTRTASPLLAVGDGAPAVTLRRLVLRGQVLVNSTTSESRLSIERCIFNGSSHVADDAGAEAAAKAAGGVSARPRRQSHGGGDKGRVGLVSSAPSCHRLHLDRTKLLSFVRL